LQCRGVVIYQTFQGMTDCELRQDTATPGDGICLSHAGCQPAPPPPTACSCRAAVWRRMQWTSHRIRPWRLEWSVKLRCPPSRQSHRGLAGGKRGVEAQGPFFSSDTDEPRARHQTMWCDACSDIPNFLQTLLARSASKFYSLACSFHFVWIKK